MLSQGTGLPPPFLDKKIGEKRGEEKRREERRRGERRGELTLKVCVLGCGSLLFE